MNGGTRNLLAALAVGYVVGAKTRGKSYEELGRSLRALGRTPELAEVISAARAQVASGLKNLASTVEGGAATVGTRDHVGARVKRLVGER
jgi:hypothetical protein